MRKDIEQLLKNQKTMLAVLRILSEERNLEGYTVSLNDRRDETIDLLSSPTKTKSSKEQNGN